MQGRRTTRKMSEDDIMHVQRGLPEGATVEMGTPLKLAKTRRSGEHVKLLDRVLMLPKTSESQGWDPRITIHCKNESEYTRLYYGLKSARARRMEKYRAIQIFKRIDRESGEFTLYLMNEGF